MICFSSFLLLSVTAILLNPSFWNKWFSLDVLSFADFWQDNGTEVMLFIKMQVLQYLIVCLNSQGQLKKICVEFNDYLGAYERNSFFCRSKSYASQSY